ncbi:universal stress protein [Kitasatospora viridis]|uniref:universal stress protein n=1 Tax=Kitasatospora viridis TaxID=281105 RepID=UPI002482A4C6|nr:universal stress protein [Kitasatospora viridis]
MGVSGGRGSAGAVRRALREAGGGAVELVLVHAWRPPGGERSFRRHPDARGLAEVREAAAGRLDEALRSALAGAGPGTAVRGALVRGRPRRVLVAVTDRGADLLVVGAGRGLLRRGLRRSVTAHCLRHAGCPVLTVPGP